jgi:hypothetical protein
MTDCPNCEYHRKRAQLWRDEAYKQAGHPLPEREWVGLSDEDFYGQSELQVMAMKYAEAKLKEKNG